MSRHWLEAIITKQTGPMFRVVCENPTLCQEYEGNESGCIYRKSFWRNGNTVDMVGWPDIEYVMGKVELRHTVTEPMRTLVPDTDSLISREQPSITCPQCKIVSYDPDEINNNWCGNCSMYHADMVINEEAGEPLESELRHGDESIAGTPE